MCDSLSVLCPPSLIITNEAQYFWALPPYIISSSLVQCIEFANFIDANEIYTN